METITTRLPKVSSSPFSSRPTVDVRWPSSSFPLNLKISQEIINEYASNDYSTHGPEIMSSRWNGALSGINVFTTPFAETTTFGYSSLNGFDDFELGIYKSDNWFNEVSSSALAVTQYFGVRRNTGTASEYIELIHADIILNFRDFLFSTTGESTKYDLSSVILHEMGHLLGLGHYSGFQPSVMDPFIDRGEIKRALYSVDISAIENNYQQALGDAQRNAVQVSSPAIGPNDQIIRGIIELRANGTCRHSHH